MSKFYNFGELVDGYSIRVFNEREVRAASGILFLGAIIAFMNAWLLGEFQFTRMFVVYFLIDFSVRMFVNPQYSPSMFIGRLIVRNQNPEYVGAIQKKIAWGFGLILALSMFFLIVINQIIGPINLAVCFICLTLMFFETAFGICLGCKFYPLFTKKKPELCPGEVCEIKRLHSIQRVTLKQFLLVSLFMCFSILSIKFFIKSENPEANDKQSGLIVKPDDKTNTTEKCLPPEWAIKIGHGEKWKRHHGCQ